MTSTVVYEGAVQRHGHCKDRECSLREASFNMQTNDTPYIELPRWRTQGQAVEKQTSRLRNVFLQRQHDGPQEEPALDTAAWFIPHLPRNSAHGVSFEVGRVALIWSLSTSTTPKLPSTPSAPSIICSFVPSCCRH